MINNSRRTVPWLSQPRLLASAITGATLMMGSAQAQTENSFQLEEVVVTARKRQESVQDVPAAITAISADAIQAALMRDIRDVGKLAPNVNFTAIGPRAAGAAMSIRGISFQEIEKTFDPSIGVLQDGIYLSSNTGLALSAFDIERIEILRGPQGALFGKNTTGGVVSVVRAKPTGELGAKVRFTTGSDSRRDYDISFDFPIIEDTLAGKLVYSEKNDDGVADFTSSDLDNDTDRSQYSLGLLFTPNDKLEVSLRIDHEEDKSSSGALLNFVPSLNQFPDSAAFSELLFLSCTAPAVPGLGLIDSYQALLSQGIVQTSCGDGPAHNTPDDETSVQEGRNELDYELDAATLEVTMELGDYEFTSITGWRDFDERVFGDFDATGANAFNVDHIAEQEQFSQEFRLSGAIGDNVDFVAGAYYSKVDLVQDQRSHQFPTALGININAKIFAGALAATGDPGIAFAALAANGFAPGVTNVPLSVISPAFTGLGLDSNFNLVPLALNVPGVSSTINVGLTPEDAYTRKLLEQETESYAAFFSVNWQVNTELRVTLGGRYTRETKDFTTFVSRTLSDSASFVPHVADLGLAGSGSSSGVSPFSVLPGLGAQLDGDETWTEFTPTISADYRYSEEVMFYASAARGFKSGGFNGRGESVNAIEPFEPEVVTSFEVGMKGDFLNKTLRVNTALFRSEYDDKQEDIILPNGSAPPVTVVKNAADVVIQGVELEVTWLPIEGLALSFIAGYLDAEYENFDGFIGLNEDGSRYLTSAQVTALQVANGGALPVYDNSQIDLRRAAKHQYTFNAAYHHQFGSVTADYGLRYYWLDDYQTDLANRQGAVVEAIGLWDGSVRFQLENGLSVMLFGKNLADKKSLGTSVFAEPVFAFRGVGNTGRTWGLELQMEF